MSWECVLREQTSCSSAQKDEPCTSLEAKLDFRVSGMREGKNATLLPKLFSSISVTDRRAGIPCCMKCHIFALVPILFTKVILLWNRINQGAALWIGKKKKDVNLNLLHWKTDLKKDFFSVKQEHCQIDFCLEWQIHYGDTHRISILYPFSIFPSITHCLSLLLQKYFPAQWSFSLMKMENEHSHLELSASECGSQTHFEAQELDCKYVFKLGTYALLQSL